MALLVGGLSHSIPTYQNITTPLFGLEDKQQIIKHSAQCDSISQLSTPSGLDWKGLGLSGTPDRKH